MSIKIDKIITVEDKKKLYLYLDEKGQRNNKDKKNKKNIFLIAGITVDEENRKKIINFMKVAKKIISTKLKIKSKWGLEENEWELKGNSESIKKISIKKIKQRYNKYYSKQFNRKKWIIWSELLRKFDYKCTVYGTFVDNEKFIKDDLNSKEEEQLIISSAYLNTLQKFFIQNLFKEDWIDTVTENSIVKSTSIRKTFMTNTDIYFDAIEGGQKKTIYDTHNKIREHYSIFKLRDLKLIESNDYSTDDSLIMQFVDMQIYVLHRFYMRRYGNFMFGFEEFNRMSREEKMTYIGKENLEKLKKLAFNDEQGKKLIRGVTNNIAVYGMTDSSVIELSDTVNNTLGCELHNHLTYINTTY